MPADQQDQAQPPSTSPVWHRPAPEMPEVLRNPPASKPAAKPRRRMQLVPETAGSDMRAIGLGLDFAAMVGASVLLGWGADHFLGTQRGILIGLAVGLTVASWHFYKGARRLNRSFDKPKPANKPNHAPPTSLHPSAKPADRDAGRADGSPSGPSSGPGPEP